MKKAIIALAFIIALLAIGETALAAPSDFSTQTSGTGGAELRLTLISTITPTLSVSGTTASYYLTVKCPSTVTSIKATLQLQVLSGGTWTNYGSSWAASAQTSVLLTNGTKAVASGSTYRLMVTVTSSDGTTTGTATAYSA